MSDVATTQTTASPDTTTQTTTPPPANTSDARTADGTIKDVNSPLQAEPAPVAPPEGEPAPKDAKTTTPEAYTFKAPEGFKLDEKLIAEATPVFKEMGLTQDAAQKLVDMYSKQAIANAKASETVVATMRSEQRALIDRDPALGPRVDAVKADISKMLTAVNDKGQRLIPQDLEAKFRSDMDLTGAGDFHSIVKVLNILSGQFVEGSHVLGAGPSPHGQQRNGRQDRPSPAASMYPTLPHS